MIDLVIPVFNPTRGWDDLLVQRLSELRRSYQVRLILVDDGSSSSQELTAAFERIERELSPVVLIRQAQNKGKGAALRAGLSASKSPFSLFTDADVPYTLQSMLDVIKALELGADVSLGFREQDYYASVPWFRKGMSVLFRLLLRKVLRSPITDTQCGLKGMNANGKEIFLTTSINRFLVDLEFIKLAVRSKHIAIQPVVVHLREDVVFSRMGLPVILREAFNFVLILFR